MSQKKLLGRIARLNRLAAALADKSAEIIRELGELNAMVGDSKNTLSEPARHGRNSVSFRRLAEWLKKTKTPDGQPLESKLEGGSFEALVHRQEKFYQERFGANFMIDLAKISIEASRLPAIAKGLETGAVNYPLIIATPENIDSAQRNFTQAEFAYRRLLKPLKTQGLKVWDETGTERWTGLRLKEVLDGYIPVELSDFNLPALEADWQAEIKRIIGAKKQAPKVQAGQARIVFTDARQDIPKTQKPVNQQGQEVGNLFSFIEMIKSRVKALAPQEWIALAAQTFAEDQETYLSRNTWEWQMAVLDHKGKTKDASNPPVSAAIANSDGDGADLDSINAGYGCGNLRWRCSL